MNLPAIQSLLSVNWNSNFLQNKRRAFSSNLILGRREYMLSLFPALKRSHLVWKLPNCGRRMDRFLIFCSPLAPSGSCPISRLTLIAAVVHPFHSFAATFNRLFCQIRKTSPTSSQAIGLSIALLMQTGQGMQQLLAWDQQRVKILLVIARSDPWCYPNKQFMHSVIAQNYRHWDRIIGPM